MALLPLELRNTYDSAKAGADLDRALSSARKRIARRRTLGVAASTLGPAIFACVAWVALTRFTLLDVPRWPVLLIMLGWLLILLIVSRLHRISVSQSARYLDRSLALDERLSTLYELARSTPVRGLQPSGPRVPAGLLEDTAFQLKARRVALPGAWIYHLKRGQALAIAASLVCLVAAILLPTTLDKVREERAELRRTVNLELNKVAQLKAELVSRPGLDETDRQQVAAELDALTKSLSNQDMDRSAMLAALSDAQQKLQEISPQTSADFNNILASARTMQLATVNASRNAPVGTEVDWGWDPANFPDLSDLGKAASAATALGERVQYLSSPQIRISVPLLDRASTQAAPADAELAQRLLDASRAIGDKDTLNAVDALSQASILFAAADHRWQLTQSVEKIMANLDEGRQTLAQAGTQTEKKGQVGFRRPGAPPSPANGAAQPGTTPGDTPSSEQGDQGQHGVSLNAPSAFGANMGGNSPDYKNGGNTSGGAGSAGGNAGDKASTQQGSGPANQPGVAGGAGAAQPGSGSSGSDDGTQGTFTGQVSGPMGGGGGAISQVPNPEGQGIGGSTPGAQPDAVQQVESVYVPAGDENVPSSDSTTTGLPGQAAPQQNGIEGRGAQGGDGAQTPSEMGAGARSQIRTPYTDVIGQYAEQATQALDRVYVPADARDYVKNYFTQLGK
jgi:hypothetical protein